MAYGRKPNDDYPTTDPKYRKNDYTVRIGKTRSEGESYHPYGSYGAYFPSTGRMTIRYGNIREAREEVKALNRNQRDARLHKSGFKLRHRRSYEEVERKLPGAGRYEDESDAAARTISHESLHKAIHKTGGQYASHKLDDIYARKGFHGIVRQPTRFLVGEAGPERVNVTPLRNNHIQHVRMNSFKVNIGISGMRKTPSIFGKGSLGKLARF